MLKKAIDCLEDIASQLEEKGLSDQSLQLDAVVNTLEGAMAQPLRHRRDYDASSTPEVEWLKKFAPKVIRDLASGAKTASTSTMREYQQAKDYFLAKLNELREFYADPENWKPEPMDGYDNPGSNLSDKIDPLHPDGVSVAQKEALKELDAVIKAISSGYEPSGPGDTSKDAEHTRVIKVLDKYIRDEFARHLHSESKGMRQNEMMEAWQAFNKAYVLNFVDLRSLGLGGLQVL